MNDVRNIPTVKKFISFSLCLGLIMMISGMVFGSPSHEQVKADMAKATQITIDEAVQTAIKEVPGTVIKAELEKEHGPLMWEIEIVTSEGKVQEVHLDGASGKRLAFESGEGSEHAPDSAIHAGSAEPKNQKMKEQSSDKVEAKEPTQEKKP